MTTIPLVELRTALAEVIATELGTPLAPVEAAVVAATQGWTAHRNTKLSRDDLGMIDGSNVQREIVGTLTDGYYLEIRTPWQPFSPGEQAERDARAAAASWAVSAYFGEDAGPPPERVGALDMLEQDIWWRARIRLPDSPEGERRYTERTEPIRVEDMAHDHRLALLSWLRQRAHRFKEKAEWRMAGGPQPSGDMACDAFEAELNELMNQPASEWIEQQPLVQALVHWTTPYGEAPLTWRPMSEAPRNGLVMTARWSDLPQYGVETITWYQPDGDWVPVGAEGYGGFDDNPDQWRWPITDARTYHWPCQEPGPEIAVLRNEDGVRYYRRPGKPDTEWVREGGMGTYRYTWAELSERDRILTDITPEPWPATEVCDCERSESCELCGPGTFCDCEHGETCESCKEPR